MDIQKTKTAKSTLLSAAFVLGAALSFNAFAVNGSGAQLTPHEQYRLDIQRCEAGQTGQDLATCKKEAAAALQAAQQQNLIVGSPNYDQNLTIRCESLPAELREECLIQMQGNGEYIRTQIDGSVESGGILRRTEIITPSKVIKEGVDYIPQVADPARIRQAEQSMGR